MSEKLVNITWGIPLEPETPNEFLNLDIAQYSKGDCSQTFFLESDGQFERTENLFALATFTGNWTFENGLLVLAGHNGTNLEFKIKEITENKLVLE
jgi:hypothetical protein